MDSLLLSELLSINPFPLSSVAPDVFEQMSHKDVFSHIKIKAFV